MFSIPLVLYQLSCKFTVPAIPFLPSFQNLVLAEPGVVTGDLASHGVGESCDSRQ